MARLASAGGNDRARSPTCRASWKAAPDNPLGARAMYLGAHDLPHPRHPQPWTIGTSVSSGCIRLTNDDVTDLYQRVKIGTKVIVE